MLVVSIAGRFYDQWTIASNLVIDHSLARSTMHKRFSVLYWVLPTFEDKRS